MASGIPKIAGNHERQLLTLAHGPGSPHARYALMAQTAQGWQVQLRSVAYDFERMARLAELRGRTDWAFPLRTGRTL